MQKLAARLRIPILGTLHESRNEADVFRGATKVEGGKGIGYNTKFIIYVMKEKNLGILPANKRNGVEPAPLPANGRYLWNMRVPGTSDWTKYVGIDFTDKGFIPLEA